jgi:hypothetical protein
VPLFLIGQHFCLEVHPVEGQGLFPHVANLFGLLTSEDLGDLLDAPPG